MVIRTIALVLLCSSCAQSHVLESPLLGRPVVTTVDHLIWNPRSHNHVVTHVDVERPDNLKPVGVLPAGTPIELIELREIRGVSSHYLEMVFKIAGGEFSGVLFNAPDCYLLLSESWLESCTDRNPETVRFNAKWLKDSD